MNDANSGPRYFIKPTHAGVFALLILATGFALQIGRPGLVVETMGQTFTLFGASAYLAGSAGIVGILLIAFRPSPPKDVPEHRDDREVFQDVIEGIKPMETIAKEAAEGQRKAG